MATGVENINRLFTNDSEGVKIAMIVGVVTMGVIYVIRKIYVAVTKKEEISIVEVWCSIDHYHELAQIYFFFFFFPPSFATCEKAKRRCVCVRKGVFW